MQPRIIHGLQSRTFVSPPLDVQMSLPDMYEWHRKHSAKHPLFVFENVKGDSSYVTWEEAVLAARQASKFIKSRKRVCDLDDGVVIGIIASLDTITYFCVLVGVIRMGWTVFPLSPRNSADVMAELLTKASVTHIVASSTLEMQKLAATSVSLLSDGRDIEILAAPTFDDLFLRGVNEEEADVIETCGLNLDSPAAILHSSGTTGNPKPVIWSHRALRQFAIHPCYGTVDLESKAMSIHAMGMHHGIGMLQVAFVATTGLVLSVFKPRVPPIVPDPVNVIETAMRLKSNYIYCAPAFIEIWARTQSYVKDLARLDGLLFGGGPLNREVGDKLARKGVNIMSSYGSTQCGRLSAFCTEPRGIDWEYFEFVDYMSLKFLPSGEGTFEAVILESKDFCPCILNCEIEGKRAYATGDLVSCHPTDGRLWRLIGRIDDQIMLSTGLKTNPRPLEKILEEDPRIHSAVMFGRGRYQCGLLVQPTPEYAASIKKETGEADFIASILPAIHKLNQHAPPHSRLFKEMILVASPDKPFMYNSKGSAKRDATLVMYESEIETLYNSSAEVPIEDGPESWQGNSTIKFIRRIVQNIMETEGILDDADIFNAGCDSLQATWILNTILSVARRTDPEIARRIPSNVVYQHSSILTLSTFLTGCFQRESDKFNSMSFTGLRPFTNQTTDFAPNVRLAAEEYTSDLLAMISARRQKPEQSDCVLLTGSSGSLGVNIFSQMIKDDGIKRIYAVSRASKAFSLMEKHALAFNRAGLDEAALASKKIVFISADLALPNLGLKPDILNEMRSSVTHIVHNGWRVDFNASLRSFDSCLRGTINLISFALSSETATPPRFIFISSVGVVRDAPGIEPVLEEAINAMDCPTDSGYSESKWIAETLLVEARFRTGLRPVVVRLGQLAGCDNGAWRENEWFPSLIKSSAVLGCLPDVRGAISWLTCSTVARVILEIRDSCEPFLHVVHPAGVSWSEIIGEFSARMRLRICPYSDWLSALEISGGRCSEGGMIDEEEMRSNPALKLLGYFQHADASSAGREQLGARILSTMKAMKESPTMRSPDLPGFGGCDVDKWLGCWYASGFLVRGTRL